MFDLDQTAVNVLQHEGIREMTTSTLILFYVFFKMKDVVHIR